MGNNYTSLATADPADVLANSTFPNNSPKGGTQVRPSVHSDTITSLALVRPGMVITGSKDRTIALNNIDSGEVVLKWQGHDQEVTKLAYQNTVGKHMILSGGRDSLVKLWQFSSAEPARIFKGHSLVISGLTTIDDSRFVSGSRDCWLRKYDIEKEVCIKTAQRNRNLVTHISKHPKQNCLIQSSEDKSVKVWDNDLELLYTLPTKNNIQLYCDFLSEFEENLAVSTSNGFNGDGCEITLWDLRTRKIVKELRGHEGSVTSVCFIQQQITWKKLLFSCSNDRTVRIWNLEEGICMCVEELPGATDLYQCVAFSDSHIVVCGGNGYLAHLKVVGRAGKPAIQILSIQKIGKSHSTVQLDNK